MTTALLQLGILYLLELLLLLPFCYIMNIQPFTVMHTAHLAVLLGLFVFQVNNNNNVQLLQRHVSVGYNDKLQAHCIFVLISTTDVDFLQVIVACLLPS